MAESEVKKDWFWWLLGAGILALAFWRIGYYVWYTKQVIVKPLADDWGKYGKCKKDVDCVWVASPSCSGCGCGVSINREAMGDYSSRLETMCEGQSPDVCIQPVCPEADAKCVSGYCVGARRKL